MWKITAIIAYILIIPIIIMWLADSSDYGKLLVFSRDSKIVEKKEIDELFGTETTETSRQEGFWLGLLPPSDQASVKALLGALPITGILFVIGSGAFIIHMRKKKASG